MSAGGRMRIVIAIGAFAVAGCFGVGWSTATPPAAWATEPVVEPLPTDEPIESTPPATEPEPEPTPTTEPEPTEEPVPTTPPPTTEAPATEAPPPTETPSQAPVLEPVPPAVLAADDDSPWSWIIAVLVLLASAAVLFAIRRPGAPEVAT